MLQWGRLCAAHLPVIFAIIFTINLAATYIVAVLRGDVEPLFPYVSATGDHRPESCFFSLLLNLTSALSILIIYLRFLLVDELLRGSDVVLGRVNVASCALGMLGGAAMMVVANFQESAVVVVHLSAACVCFGAGTLYMVLTSWLTLKMHPNFNNKMIGIIRMALSVASTIAFFVALGFGTYAAHVFHQTYPNLPTPRPWSRRIWQPGYSYHVVSAAAEWTMAMLHVSFILSFSRDFEKLRVKLTAVSLVQHLDHSPLWRSINHLDGGM